MAEMTETRNSDRGIEITRNNIHILEPFTNDSREKGRGQTLKKSFFCQITESCRVNPRPSPSLIRENSQTSDVPHTGYNIYKLHKIWKYSKQTEHGYKSV